MRQVATAAACLLIISSAVHAQSIGEVTVTSKAEQGTNPGPADYFVGDVSIMGAFQATSPGRSGGATVVFAPGARTNWHTHPAGQTLIVTEGTGLVQSEGGGVKEMAVGDIVWIPAGVKHWHGATANERMTHIAIAETVDGSAVAWMEPVTDAQYAR